MPFLLRVELPDVPGSLGRLATAIGEAGGDIEAIEIVEKRPRRHQTRRRRRAARDRARRDARLDRLGVQRARRRPRALDQPVRRRRQPLPRPRGGRGADRRPRPALDRLVDLLPATFRVRLGRPGPPDHRRPARHRRRARRPRLRRDRRRRAARGRATRDTLLRRRPARRRTRSSWSAAAAAPTSSTPSSPASATSPALALSISRDRPSACGAAEPGARGRSDLSSRRR